ncbi:hypothetical protein [Paraburkholderia humisilvae]|uniref:hypothetical protein n=1 Tax=Paraburkholderia humisilvae TaxID=627669 RepID=UPI001FE94757|nr:hypothetical protein [Paraburkholderia humisilvae]
MEEEHIATVDQWIDTLQKVSQPGGRAGLHAISEPSAVHPFQPGDRVRVSDRVKTRYFPQSEPARRAGWVGTINSLCDRPFEDHVRVDFDLRPRQRRQRLKEFMDVLDLELIQKSEAGTSGLKGGSP